MTNARSPTTTRIVAVSMTNIQSQNGASRPCSFATRPADALWSVVDFGLGRVSPSLSEGSGPRLTSNGNSGSLVPALLMGLIREATGSTGLAEELASVGAIGSAPNPCDTAAVLIRTGTGSSRVLTCQGGFGV